MTSAVRSLARATLSAIMARFSSRGISKATSTWKSHDLPNRQTASTLLCRTAVRPGSLAAERPARRVMPKATKRAFCSTGGAAKKASSVGSAPEKSTPWVCAPSRRVVSKR